jgi:hypothetical protein
MRGHVIINVLVVTVLSVPALATPPEASVWVSQDEPVVKTATRVKQTVDTRTVFVEQVALEHAPPPLQSSKNTLDVLPHRGNTYGKMRLCQVGSENDRTASTLKNAPPMVASVTQQPATKFVIRVHVLIQQTVPYFITAVHTLPHAAHKIVDLANALVVATARS